MASGRMARQREEIILSMAKTKSGQTSDEPFSKTPPKLRKGGRLIKSSVQKSFQENNGKKLPKGPGVYGRPEARADEDAEDDDEERLGDDDEGPVAAGYASDENQYNVHCRRDAKPTQKGQLVGVDQPLLGTYGRMSQEEARDCEPKVIF